LRRSALAAGVLSFATVVLAGSLARAQREGDGFYGRFDGDLELRAHAGAAFGSGGPALAASVSAVYLSTAGLYVHYTDACGSDAPMVARSIAAGVHLQPIFLLRAASFERGPAFLDLLIDSFAFELGAVWSAPRRSSITMGTSVGETPGLEAALGVAIPLIGRATGPFLGFRAALRWRSTDFVPGPPSTIADRGALLSLTLGWHHVLRTHLVDAGDRVRP
jgi:hypothetical protein